ncbi:hypothetical protein Lal_00025266 [Lupinus albus]|nr:hypothetical protein Lal_00025266 [Lupinus albus]
MLTLIHFVSNKGDEREYLSSYSIDRSESNDIEALQGLTPEFLNSLGTSGLPNHKIKLKVGTPIMLLRNLYKTEGLCNGTRMIVNRLATHVVEAKSIEGLKILIHVKEGKTMNTIINVMFKEVF